MRHDTLRLLIDRHQTFRMELTQGHMRRHLLFIDRLQAIQGKSGAFADTDTGGPHAAESVALQGVGETELLLQALILLKGKRSRQILVARWEILATNEVGGDGDRPCFEAGQGAGALQDGQTLRAPDRG
jgi:hypothetical protein